MASWKRQKSLRGMIISGARQVGKTTLARLACPEMDYVNLDDPLTHVEFEKMGGEEFSESYPQAVLDEVQKVPALFHLVKYGIDTRPRCRYLLLGSAQILLLERVRESLAGRALVRELYPLAFCERFPSGPKPWVAGVLDRFGKNLEPEPPGAKKVREIIGETRREWKRHLSWGGMPAQLAIQSEEEWKEWLKNYVATYLQRDLRDLARIQDLAPFRKCEQLIALRTGKLLNYSELARDAGISVQTAKNYCSYLDLSFQTLLVEPYFGNPSKRLIKSPKVYMIDIGIQKVLSGQWEGMTGPQYESLVAAELKKVLSAFHPDWNLHHLRTFDGLEVDFLLVKGDKAVAIEVKYADRVHPQDARRLAQIENVTGIPRILKFVLYEGQEVRELQEGIWGVPACIFFGPDR
ncbi:MAG: ATP-binding protein [Nitrospirae bacterium]|nr:ATP-binding protein [Nitrospirota bacterium]